MRTVLLFTLLLFTTVASSLRAQSQPPVYVVLFTHIEDNQPSSTLGTPDAAIQYRSARSNAIAMGRLAARYGVQWVYQPDWKLLRAALIYEDSAMRSSTGGLNLFRYLRDSLGVVIDPHSHEKLGYNYTDVAHLLDSLGVGGSNVIGGHVYDPTLPQFQEWDRFRDTVAGTTYPWAKWRGEILMGSGTPNHVDDPCPSGVWRPMDRFNYWMDDPAGNIVCVGQYKGDISSIAELVDFYRTGEVDTSKMLTATYHINPSTIQSSATLAAVEDTVLKPLVAMRDRGEVELTDFTSLVSTWRSRFGARAYIYDCKGVVTTSAESERSASGMELRVVPHPVERSATSVIELLTPSEGDATLVIHDMVGRVVWEHSFELEGKREYQFRLPELDPGMYVLSFVTSGRVTYRPFVQM
ncbi:MAG: T9SS type A sorting domain-containing protein [Candidatus Kapaibacterium sp.]